MKIFILEDDYRQQGRMETLLQKLSVQNNLPLAQLEIFSRAERLLEAIEERGSHQLFLLAMEIKGNPLGGLELAKQIRQQDSQAIIVFVTSHSELMSLTFRSQVSALDFIDKGLEPDDFEKRIEAVLLYVQRQEQKTVGDVFFFQGKYSQLQIPFEEIYYLETSPKPHRILLHYSSGTLEFFASLEEVLEQDSRFYQCHRSYIINLKNVIRVDRRNRMVYFQDQKSCLISRIKITELLVTLRRMREGSTKNLEHSD